MPPSSLKVLARYHYDPLDRLMGVELLARVSTRRFYQEHYLATELDGQGQRSIMRHAAQPLAQQQSMAGISETTLLATDQAHSLLQTLTGTHLQPLAYTAYGHHPAESGLSRLLGFNGECPDSVTGHYLLGQGKRAYNPVLMRFNSPDDLSPFDEGGINSYAYCGNDPINFYDSSGNMRLDIVMRGRIVPNSRGTVIVPPRGTVIINGSQYKQKNGPSKTTHKKPNAPIGHTLGIPDERRAIASKRQSPPTKRNDTVNRFLDKRRSAADEFDRIRKDPEIEKLMDSELVNNYKSIADKARKDLDNLLPAKAHGPERRKIYIKVLDARRKTKYEILKKLKKNIRNPETDER